MKIPRIFSRNASKKQADVSKFRAMRAERAERAGNAVMTIIFCLVGLAILSRTLSLGLHGIYLDVRDTFKLAEAEHASLENHVAREQVLRQRLDTLIASKLGRQLFETHTECLGRGINSADLHFHGQDYTDHPDILNSTIVWVKENCDRIFFSPTIPRPEGSREPFTGWKFIAHRAKSVVTLLKQWVRWSPALTLTRRSEEKTPKTRASYANYLYLPPDFQLVDCDVPPCKLVYIPPMNVSKPHISPEEAAHKAESRVMRLLPVMLGILLTFVVFHTLTMLLVVLQMLFLAVLACYVLQSGPTLEDGMPQYRPTVPWLSSHEPCLIRFVNATLLEIVYFGLSVILDRICPRLPVEIYTTLVTLSIAFFSFFLVPTELPLPNVFLLCSAIKQLYGAMRSRPDMALSPATNPPIEVGQDGPSKPEEPSNSEAPSTSDVAPSSVTATVKHDGRSTYAKTTLQEDLKAALEAARAEMNSEPSVKKDSTSTSNGEAEFVDAKTGHQMVDVDLNSDDEYGSDWSVVPGEI